MPSNDYDQPIGAPVEGWTRREIPPRSPIEGRFCRLEPYDVDRHARPLFEAFGQAPDGRDWTYIPVERFATFEGYRDYAAGLATSVDPQHHAIVDLASGRPCGTAALMRIDPANGVIEVGHVLFAPALQKTVAATEAIFVLMRRVFDELGYRRFEWKCDSLNAPSRRAAERLGFVFEGIFRQAIVTKGRNRDTAWYAMTDRDWPRVKAGFETWLATGNFDAHGRQRATLAECRGSIGGGA